MKGLAISNSEVLREAHNSFAKPEPFVIEDSKDDKEGEAFHFISYLPFEGAIYELDGLKPGPFKLTEYSSEGSWINAVQPFIQERIERYAGKEIRFNLLAVTKTKLSDLKERKEKLEESKKENAGMEEFIDQQIRDINFEIGNEERKRDKWKKENIRRRHNYIPAVINLLQILAEKKQLMPLIEAVKKRKEEKDKK